VFPLPAMSPRPCLRELISRLRPLALSALLLALSATTTYYLIPLPTSLSSPTPSTLTLLDIHDREFAELPSATARVQRPVTLDAMGSWLPKITVALEDHRFYEHRGIDWRSAFGSIWRDVRAVRIVRGGSTITQQLIKLADGRLHRSWKAKLYEMLAAWKLEHRWSKQRILTEYLNRCQYGHRLAGPEAAARWYFGKPARDLTLTEATYLAGLPQAPTRFSPWRHPSAAEAKYRRSVAALRESGVLNEEQAAGMNAAPPTVGHFVSDRQAPHFIQALLRQKPALTGTVRTTLDLDLQNTAEEFVRSHLRTLNRNDITGAAVVVLENSTGAVRALVGSPDFARSQVNSALATHSCGSTLKPFVYLRAIDRGLLTAASILPDTPDAIRETYADYDPRDYNRRYLGPVRVREALACSLNVPAVVALSKVGARNTFFELQRWGFRLPRSLDDYGAGFILGNAEVRPLDLAAAYAGLARGGVVVTPEFIPSPRHVGERLASAEATAIITDILCDNNARTRSFGVHSALDVGARVAAKTGTSSGFRDAWTVGFTRDHTVAVWVGNPDGHPMRETLAIRAATPLWAVLISHLLKSDAPVAPTVPSEKLVTTRVCSLTGLLPSANSPVTVAEWFLAGTAPTTDSTSSFASGPDGKPHLLLPSEYATWCQSAFNTLGAIHPQDQQLAISEPRDHATFEIDPAVPLTQQMLELKCNGSIGRDVRWYVNDRELPAQSNGRVFWSMAPGDWRISAKADGQSAEVSVRVE